jgi:tellurite resistance protein TerC
LGLRSLYFVLAGAIEYFRYLKIGLSIVLVFIGVKMLLEPHGDEAKQPWWFQVDIPTSLSLAIVAGIIFISILISILTARRHKQGESSSS